VESTKRLTIKVRHASCHPGARWCRPVGWSPTNAVEGADWDEATGAWWDAEGEAAAIVVFGCDYADNGTQTTVSRDILWVVSAGDCRLIGEVAT